MTRNRLFQGQYDLAWYIGCLEINTLGRVSDQQVSVTGSIDNENATLAFRIGTPSLTQRLRPDLHVIDVYEPLKRTNLLASRGISS